MKNSTNQGFDQHYNVQIAVDQSSQIIIAHSLSNHPNDKQEVEPTLAAISPKIDKPKAAALDSGYFSEHNIAVLEAQSIDPFIAVGQDKHEDTWQDLLTQPAQQQPPLEKATPAVKMAYKLKTEPGKSIYRLRKSTVEPVFGIIKEVLGFRQFSLRGLFAAAAEWTLVCLAFNLKRLHQLSGDNSLS